MPKTYLLIAFLSISVYALGKTLKPKNIKPRVLISTDIGGTDPDDNQSMAHLLMYNNLFDIEGLVSSPSFGDGSVKEIHKMIDLYEQDLPRLKKHQKGFLSPDSLRTLCKQGRHGASPIAGYDKPTEGSEWIVKCARKKDTRPLWVLVWGGIDDLAQALHDAPDIKENIRVYWIGGPNKKWSVNSYAYIAQNFPDLWMIENNASYRGFITDSKDNSVYHKGFYNTFIKGAGALGKDFINYYNGIVKMGDSPSLFYLMQGNPDTPETDSWGGCFEPTKYSARVVVNINNEQTDTVPVYSVVELHIKGKHLDLPANTPCFTLHIDKQEWQGYYMGGGDYLVRYSPKAPAVLQYEIRSYLSGTPAHKGTLVVSNLWPGKPTGDCYKLGEHWYTDKTDATLFKGDWQGFKTVEKYREAVLKDWAERLGWLK